MSYSVLSGCGTCSQPRNRDFKDLEPLLEDIPIEVRPFNIYFTESLYKKCMPQYEANIENPYNFESFKWTDKKKKMLIDIDVMANSIIACCNLVERLLTFELQVDNPNFIIYILYKTASNQANFIRKHLRVGSMFYNGEDVADRDSGELHIQIAAESPDIVSQFAVLHAFSALYQLSCYNLYYVNTHEEDLLEDLKILPGILTGLMEEVQKYSSKELALVGLHLVETYKTSPYAVDTLRKALSSIPKELCQRVLPDGELQRHKGSEEFASIATKSNCLNLLAQCAYMFASKSCYESSHKIYQQFSMNWDLDGRVFRIKSSNKQSYSIKDVAAITSALYSLIKITHDIDEKAALQKQIISFADAVLIKSGIFNGQPHPILQQNKIESQDSLVSDKQWAPVFNKGFEYKISKRKYYCEADVFRADYVLPACAILLNSINS